MTIKKDCFVKGCTREIFIIKHGLCRAHYDRYRLTGDVGSAPIIKRRNIEPYIHIKTKKEAESEIGRL